MALDNGSTMMLSASSVRPHKWMFGMAIAAILALPLADRAFVTTHDQNSLPKLIPPNELSQARARLAIYTPGQTDQGSPPSLAVFVERDLGLVIASASRDGEEQIFDLGDLRSAFPVLREIVGEQECISLDAPVAVTHAVSAGMESSRGQKGRSVLVVSRAGTSIRIVAVYHYWAVCAA